MFKIFKKKPVKDFSFNFNITYITSKNIVLETDTVHIVIPAKTRQEAEVKLKRFVSKKISIKIF